MLTFYAGVATEALLALAGALLVQGIRHYRAARSWRLAEERYLTAIDPATYTTRPLPVVTMPVKALSSDA